MEDNQKDDIWGWLEINHVLVHKYKIVECDEYDDSYEVRIDELPTADFSITHQLLDERL